MEKIKIAVAAAHDAYVLHAVQEVLKKDSASFILVGRSDCIKETAEKEGIDLSGCEILDCEDKDCALESVRFVKNGRAQVLMKGLLQTADIMRAVLNKEEGLRTGRTLSHISVLKTPEGREIIVTDAAMIPYPDFKQKVDIVKNAVEAASKMGKTMPKVAILAAVENVNPDMPSTMDAAAISLMNQRGQIKNCTVDGPLAFDNAFSKEAAEHKGIKSPIQGDADILVTPNIEAGNVLVKSAVYIGKCLMGGFIWGAAAPIVLTSRADSIQSKVFSIECAVKAAGGNI